MNEDAASPTSLKKVKSKIIILPRDIFKQVIQYLNDDEIYEIRSVSKLFYCSYFNQLVDLPQSLLSKFNVERAVRLAMMGRIFYNVEYLNVDIEIDVTIEQRYFPKLKHLRIYESDVNEISCTLINSFHSIRILHSKLWYYMPRWVSCDVLPNLEKFIWDGGLHGARFSELGVFPKVKAIIFKGYCPSWVSVDMKIYFPSLSTITFYQNAIDDYFWSMIKIDCQMYSDDNIYWHGPAKYKLAQERHNVPFRDAVQKLRSQGVTVLL
jgi:hypothetical protein